MSSNNSRLPYIDTVKLFAIFCVVVGHLLQYNIDYGSNVNGYKQDSLYLFIYSFHMQLFMLVSGMFLGSSLRLPFRDMVVKKAKQLLLPSYSWKLFFIALSAIITFTLSGECGIHITKDTFLRPYWFLTCVFLCYLICYVSIHLINNKYLAGLISCILICILPKTDFCYLNAMLPFFWFGYWLKDIIIGLNRKLTSISFVVSLVVFGTLFPSFEFDMTMYSFSNSLISWNDFALVSSRSVGLMLFRIVLAFSASWMIISGNKLLFENLQNEKLMAMGGVQLASI